MKNTINFLLALMVFALFSCDTDVPDTDTTPPTFSLRVTGDGFDRTFTLDNNFDTGELKLKNGTMYNFALSGIDQGGVKQIQFQMPTDYIQLADEVPAPWVETQAGLSTTVTWNGDRNNALTAGLLSGGFEAAGDNIFSTLYIRVEDFGGDAGTSNVIDVTINIHIDNHDTEFFELI